MSQAALIAVLIITFWACVSALTLTQPSTVTSSLGGTVTLTCTGDEDISNKYVHWYQQRPGNAPRLLIYDDSNRPSGIPDRFSGSGADDSSKTARVTISGVQAEDDADYYCQVWDSSNSAIFGAGTKLAVKTSAPKAPSVSLLPPSIDELTNKRTATLVCLLGNFFPRTATVAWKRDNNLVSVGILNSEIKADSGADYKMSSYLTLSEQDWKTYDQYTCEVSHESKVITQSLKRLDCLPS